jgi:hypothetical protein
MELVEMTLINPLIPQSWGIFKAGGHLQTPGRKYPAPLFQRSLSICTRSSTIARRGRVCYYDLTLNVHTGNTPPRERKPVIVTGNCLNYIDTAEIVSINPLYPPILGVFYIWGTPPDPRQKVSCTSFSAVLFMRNC